MKKIFLIVLSALVLTSCKDMPGNATGGTHKSLTLAWDASTSEGVTGYMIYMGKSSRNYYKSFDAGNVRTYTVTNLDPGTYYFACTAYDNSDNESGYSNEVHATLYAD